MFKNITSRGISLLKRENGIKNFVLIVLLLLLKSSSSNFSLTVQVDNFKVIQGHLVIGIYNTSEKYLKPGEEILTARIPVNSEVVNYTFEGLEPGDYAISIFHDKNSDGEINRNIFGIPKESYGFSNNIRPMLSPPNFKDCSFSMSDHRTVKIHLIGG